jgi:hypothetical protein
VNGKPKFVTYDIRSAPERNIQFMLYFIGGFIAIIVGIISFRDIHGKTKRGYTDTYGANIKMYFGSIALIIAGILYILDFLFGIF